MQWKAEKEDVSDELELNLWKASLGLMGLTQEDSWRLRQVLDRGLSNQVLVRMGIASDDVPLESHAGNSESDHDQQELEERQD